MSKICDDKDSTVYVRIARRPCRRLDEKKREPRVQNTCAPQAIEVENRISINIYVYIYIYIERIRSRR